MGEMHSRANFLEKEGKISSLDGIEPRPTDFFPSLESMDG